MKDCKSILMCVCMFLSLGTCMRVHAAQPGTSCSTAIPLGDNYNAQVTNGQSIWYSAWTFDLPLSVYFAPENGAADPAPIVEMDFSCTSGFYEDSILCSLFCKTSSGSGISFDMPHKPALSSKTMDDGTFVYYLSLGKQYRDLLLQMGISYNLEVYVKVTYKSNGTMAMAPDDLFSNCVDGPQFMHIGDTVQVAANDKSTHVIIPYVQWQEDTIIYKWTGTTPCTMSIAKTCDFDPEDNGDGNIIEYEPNIQPGDSVKATATEIYDWMNNPIYKSEAGLYFAKFYSTAPGMMEIKKAAQAPPRAHATLLRFDRTYALNANEAALFAIPNSWNDDTLNTQFTTPTEHIFKMSIATNPDFSEDHILKTYQFEKTVAGHWQGVYSSEMRTFWNNTTEQYLYVRFICSEATTITPSKWFMSNCLKNTKYYIQSTDTSFTVKRASSDFYRLNYAQWKGGNLTLSLSAKKELKVFIASDCNITLAENADNLLYFSKFTTAKDKISISADKIAAWADRVDEEGYLYMRLHHTVSPAPTLTIKSTAPTEADPIYPASTIAVVCEGMQVIVNVSEAQTIVIENAAGIGVDSWNAEPGTPHQVTLPSGTYLLRGAEETISLNL